LIISARSNILSKNAIIKNAVFSFFVLSFLSVDKKEEIFVYKCCQKRLFSTFQQECIKIITTAFSFVFKRFSFSTVDRFIYFQTIFSTG